MTQRRVEMTQGDVCPRPFKGVLLCATGIGEKTTLFKQAIELGAHCSNDLTDRVSHVIAEGPGSLKYQCALECGIPIMHPSWISESHGIWLRGDDVNFTDSVSKHRLPVFHSVVITLTGVASLDRRIEINKLVTQNGGTYVKNLERPVRVTHLVCSREPNEERGEEASEEPWLMNQSDKMLYAQKFNERGEADIHIVWEEWLWDCLTYGGRFTEDNYLVTKPRPKRKPRPRAADRLSSDDLMVTATANAIEPSSSNPSPISPAAPRRPPPRNNEDDEEELASIKRVPAVRLKIWETLMGPRGFEVAGGKLVRSPPKSQLVRNFATTVRPRSPPVDSANESSDVLDPDRNGEKLAVATSRSLLASFRRSKSFALATKDVSTQHKGKLPFQRVTTTAALVGMGNSTVPAEDSFWGVPHKEDLLGFDQDLPVASGSRTPLPSSAPVLAAGVAREESLLLLPPPAAGDSSRGSPPLANKGGIFKGMVFRVLGEARGVSVKNAVEEAGGRLVEDLDAEVDFVVVRLVSGSKMFREEPDDSLRAKYRTECWLERCMYEERVCEPTEHVAFVPVTIETPIPGAEEINLSCSGLVQSEGFWIRRLARTLGLNIAPNFSRRATHLLCPSMTGVKFEKAQEWNIPVVGMDWIERIVREGTIPPTPVLSLDDELNHPDALPTLHVATAAVAETRLDTKGKGKMKVNTDVSAIIKNGPMRRGNLSGKHPRSPQPRLSEVPPGLLFGEPSALLVDSRCSDSGLGHELPSSSLIPSSGPATSPPQSRGNSVGPRSALARENVPAVPTQISREPTLPELKLDMAQTRIPSSESPSPLKSVPSMDSVAGVGAKSWSGSSNPFVSPVRISREASKVLQETIHSLLGKRQGTDEDLQENNGRKGGKRQRPLLRSKSKDQPLAPLAPAPAPPDQFGLYGAEPEMDNSMLAALKAAGGVKRRATDEGVSAASARGEAPVAGADAGRSEEDEGDISMRVMYEDPDQKDERQRLIRLLTTTHKKEIWELDEAHESQDSDAVRSGRTRTQRRKQTQSDGLSLGSSGSNAGSRKRGAGVPTRRSARAGGH